ncbi:acetylxylan esterase [Streptomyces sp. NPDC002138]|uniref:acetylxylan esterase n=1 Tax=Streptomyces sp. NPDC002138 TaxID=3154410 RepID=UPI00332DF880
MVFFRSDWQRVITPVVDFAETLPEVDNDRIALLGSSMGGVLAPRAAAFEHRLAALIGVDGVYDRQISVRTIPGDRDQAERLLRADSAPELDAQFEQIMPQDATARWAVNHGMYVMGVDTPRAFSASYLDHTLDGGIAELIQCPTDGDPQLPPVTPRAPAAVTAGRRATGPPRTPR